MRFSVHLMLMLACLSLWIKAGQTQPLQQDTGFGGPSSVTGTLDYDRETETAVPARIKLSDRYFDFKKRFEREYGFGFGFDYNALIQFASESPDDDIAAGGVFRAFGHWTIVGRDTKNTGSLVYKVENRHRLGTDISPKDLGNEIGYAGLTAVTFSDVDWVLTNLYWNQQLLENRLAFVAGLVDVTDYIDVYGLVNPWTDFNNYAFTTNPTIPAPDQGLGVAVRLTASKNIYILGGIADTNGDPTDPGDSINSFFDEGEYFTHLEIGWASSWERRFDDNIHLTTWHADEREQAQVPDGWGLAFSYSRLFNDIWEPFFRAGYAKDGGALWEGSISTGFGYYPGKGSDVLGFGINWSRPSTDTFGPGLDDQITAELYYRWQVLKILAITPDVQLLINPALNPNEDVIGVFSIRGRISL
jgi:porin